MSYKADVSSVSPSSELYNSFRWPIYIFNLVDITKLHCNPHRRSTTVSLETFTLYSLLSANQKIYPHMLSDHQPISSKQLYLFMCQQTDRSRSPLTIQFLFDSSIYFPSHPPLSSHISRGCHSQAQLFTQVPTFYLLVLLHHIDTYFLQKKTIL